MTEKDDFKPDLFEKLELKPFKQRFPWLGGDLQTLRDTFVEDTLPLEQGEVIHIDVPRIPNGLDCKGKLIAFLDKPLNAKDIRGLVLMLHGLGGSSQRRGLRRMANTLIEAGFAVLRLNLRGADPGREFAAGTYSAKCNSDLIPVIRKAREICQSLWSLQDNKSSHYTPLFGVGISLGGTILLNACLEEINLSFEKRSLLDGLVCISSPLDLSACSSSIERPRNAIYQYWLLKRLLRQTLADPFGISESERKLLIARNNFNLRTMNSIRDFDAAITAPRWGFHNVDDYYKRASPANYLLENTMNMPKTFLVQALDDPWVLSDSAKILNEQLKSMNTSSNLQVILTSHGGHNGFHGIQGCWGDHLVRQLLLEIVDIRN